MKYLLSFIIILLLAAWYSFGHHELDHNAPSSTANQKNESTSHAAISDHPSSDSAENIYQNTNSSIFLIETDQGGGSGFCIAHTGLIATSLHVIDGAAQVSLTQNGTTKKISGITLAAIDTDRDLAILRLPSQTVCDALPLGESKDTVVGQKVYVVGNPLASHDLTASITDGLVSGIRHLANKGSVVQISAPLSPGNSGGPVLNQAGEVIGIVAFKLTAGELLNFAVPVNDLKLLLPDATTNAIIFSWKPDTSVNYQSNAYKMPVLAEKIFSDAEKATGTC